MSTAALVVVFSGITSAEGSISARRIKAAGQGEGVEPTAGIATGQKLFDFRSGFWLNLHHFLYLQAVLATPEARKSGVGTAARDAVSARSLYPESQAIWDKAVHFYMQYGKRDPLSDRDLIRSNYELSDAGNSASLKGRNLPEGMRAVLEEVAGIYRQVWWLAHDRKNREWAAEADTLIQKYGPAMATRIASAYQIDWPSEKPTVEVTIYANWAGAYTTTNSTLITISSADPEGRGPDALETLFHESSHALVEKFEKALADHLQAEGKTATFQLTHVIIFYTAGKFTSEALEKNGVSDYIPYAIRNGMYDRVADWRHYKDLCDHNWLPYLEGKTTFDEALTQIAKDL